MSLFSIFKSKTPTPKEPIMTKPAFTFNSKETYLAYRAEWKQRYLDQLKAVRAAKQGVRDANRAYSKGGPINGIWDAYRNLRLSHETTQTLLTERWAASSEAGRQMREKVAG